MQAFQILQQAGPLPIQTNFTAPLDGDMLLLVTGTLWSQTENVMLTLAVYIDNVQVGSAQIFSNGTSTHRALPALFSNLNLSSGAHVLTLSTDAIADGNDTFYAAILY
jgi:hypothetical protein